MKALTIAASSYLANTYWAWWLAQVVAIAILVWLALRWRPGFLHGRTVGEMFRGALQNRQDQIREQLEAARQSREEAVRMHQQSEDEVARARQEADQLVGRAAQTSQAIQQEIEARARQEYDRIVYQARVQIDYEREQAEIALRRRAADIVVDAAEEVVRRHLQPSTDRRIIDQSFDDMKEIG